MKSGSTKWFIDPTVLFPSSNESPSPLRFGKRQASALALFRKLFLIPTGRCLCLVRLERKREEAGRNDRDSITEIKFANYHLATASMHELIFFFFSSSSFPRKRKKRKKKIGISIFFSLWLSWTTWRFSTDRSAGAASRIRGLFRFEINISRWNEGTRGRSGRIKETEFSRIETKRAPLPVH